MADFAQMPK